MTIDLKLFNILARKDLFAKWLEYNGWIIRH